MNRIILIGNGFDLAHGMSTSYGAFINDYWGNKRKEVLNGKYNGKRFEDDNITIDRVPPIVYSDAAKGESEYSNLLTALRYNGSKVKYKNKFLEILTEKNHSLNWVDIEKEYYSLLKKSYKDFSLPRYKITALNKDFQSIESLLEEYLTKIQTKFTKSFASTAEEMSFKKSVYNIIYSDFNFKDFSESSINQLTEIEFQRINNYVKDIEEEKISISDLELSDRDIQLYQALIGIKDKRQKIKKILTSDVAPNYFRHRPEDILFVNFNYTSTETHYDNPPTDSEFGNDISTNVTHIHGILNNKTDNKIIFGFGDEIDKDYLEIEDLDDNEYLQNIKSMKYLESDSYKKLLEFINSNNYQVFIFGHSCGISDRTLLNTLFEHKNCSSVKPYYRQKNDGTDNYSEMIRNISRNFTDKASMRDKVVNKKFTEALFR
ncbi:bacteriophage abortive infection AbiH family protein [Chryseobacterium sp. WG23]|uniref:bacteriophage abortive infection AbiH family protein n=1 Tax=Chryseobacterium sp. WG23 TaxID=2926910 RepID=UPI00211EEB80|nr:bacteriophage abortive infection AbiH family protein [Chryseobacterium sp. WG23]MCQ9633529.1 bacteriophage abortive infection AbiH family protein [Chryseobacterium sp. WG23]